MTTSPSLREALLEQTFGLYFRHFVVWMTVLVPVAVTAGVLYWLVDRALTAAIPPNGLLDRARDAAAIAPRLAAAGWLVAGVAGAQAVALERRAEIGALPPTADIFTRLAPRFAATLATTMVLIVQLAVIALVGLGIAAGLAWLPFELLPRWGAAQGTARSIVLLVLLPLIVAGQVPTLWWLGRHAIAIPLQAVEGGSPWGAIRDARVIGRGQVGAVLGLLVVTSVANSVLVLLCRAAGSLMTLLVAPDRFRPIFGEGPLHSAAGSSIQLGATLAATLVTLPLVLLPLSVVYVALRHSDRDLLVGPR